MYNTALPEADTCYCQYPPFNVGGMEWIRFIGKSTQVASEAYGVKHAVKLRFQSEWKGGK